jgi:predicted nucleic acid-binding protein
VVISVNHDPGEPRLRAVFDCGTLLQAAASAGPSLACLELAESGAFALLISNMVLREVADVIARLSVKRTLPFLTETRAGAFLARLAVVGEPVREVPTVFAFPQDAAGEAIINLAIAGQAGFLVTRDKEILSLAEARSESGMAFRSAYPQIKVLDPVTFLQIIRQG